MKDEIIKIDDVNVLVTMEKEHTLSDDDKNTIKELVKNAIEDIDNKNKLG